ncbi:NADPH2:quinone reductase [Kribbella amoyensis]|uniref:NADPH2:quinone reductase n=1 Tax=Kribbella amoyensis TaxID=996641 RepID=A0A561BY78_9ACTN|nr:NADPH:quinone reductase [Kribbella amoyensis]TWD83803.1 NADPH2:quinone reductase [Kribbella amoyensis]
MKAVVHSEQGTADVLRLTDLDLGEPAAGEVRLRIAVSGVNPTDWKARSGLYGEGDIPVSVPNQDGAGIVDAVGPDVEGLSVGDRVWVTLAAHERPASGTAQEYTVVPAGRVFPLPEGAGFDLGASTGVPGITAHRALTVGEDLPTRIAPGAFDGKVVLVAGGAGAVGHAAIQLARWAGATVVTTVSGPPKSDYAKAAGAHHVVNYRDDDAAEQIRGFAPGGVDLIVEVAAGRNSALDLAVLKPRGTIAIYANDGDAPFAPNVRQNMGLNARYQFVLLYSVGWDKLTAAAEDLNAAIAAGALPVGEAAGLPLHYYSLDQAAEAHRAVECGATGKVLLKIAEL